MEPSAVSNIILSLFVSVSQHGIASTASLTITNLPFTAEASAKHSFKPQPHRKHVVAVGLDCGSGKLPTYPSPCFPQIPRLQQAQLHSLRRRAFFFKLNKVYGNI